MNYTIHLVEEIDSIKEQNQYLKLLLTYFFNSAAPRTCASALKLLENKIDKDTYKKLIKEIDLLYVR